ncbi:type I methionyl aminopeptidase [Patescibacteria group bacterium]
MSEAAIKTAEEIEIMREGGKILANILNEIKSAIKPGVDVWELEELFLDLCKKNNVIPGCKGYESYGLSAFPTGLCTSINDECVHCFPQRGRVLKDGDIVSVDTVIKHKDLFVDSAFAAPVGDVSNEKAKLLETSENALYEAISKVKHNVRVGVLSSKLQKVVEKQGFKVLKDYAGHGIGYEMHEPPEISCYGSKNEGPKLKEGMTICVESLVGSKSDVVLNTSEWSTKMQEGDFCIFEHTVLVTKDGCEILTKI